MVVTEEAERKEAIMLYRCEKCSNCVFSFARKYKPEEFIEGKTSSSVWIIGINPAQEPKGGDQRSVSDLSNHFVNRPFHRYFNSFAGVSKRVFEDLGEEHGVAHTDLIKCFRKNLKGCKGSEINSAIENCQGYLLKQISKYKPELLICNGALVSHAIQKILPPENWYSATSYQARLDRVVVSVVLSGFISQMDSYSKQRLGKEVDDMIEKVVIEVLE